MVDHTIKYLLGDISFFGSFENCHTNFDHFVKALSNTKLQKSKLTVQLAKRDFVDIPLSNFESKIATVQNSLETGFIKDKKMEKKVMYTGGWLNEKPHGFGCFTHPDGTQIEGSLLGSQFHGYQVIRSADGSVNKGFCFHNMRHGLWSSLDYQGVAVSYTYAF
jgi:hypothetical protein